MPELDHTIVHATDRIASARFLTDLLALPQPKQLGPFAVVRLGDGAALDYAEHLVRGRHWTPTHYAIKVTDTEFDAVLTRIRERGLPHWADPRHTQPDDINHLQGGRGVYVNDPDGHNIEFLTVRYTDATLSS